jgi:hypothetical protein
MLSFIFTICHLQDEYFHREDSSFSDDVEVLSQESTRDGLTFDVVRHNGAQHTEIPPAESSFSLLSPDRRGPERKKSRVKQISPERIARQNCSFRSSDSAM